MLKPERTMVASALNNATVSRIIASFTFCDYGTSPQHITATHLSTPQYTSVTHTDTPQHTSVSHTPQHTTVYQCVIHTDTPQHTSVSHTLIHHRITHYSTHSKHTSRLFSQTIEAQLLTERERTLCIIVI